MESPAKYHSAELPEVFGRLPGHHQAGMLLLPLLPLSRDERRESQRAIFQNDPSSNYLNYLHQYELFCDDFGYEAFPLKEIMLSVFAQYLSKKMKPQSIKAVLSGIRRIAITAGYEVPQRQFPLVNITLKGLGKIKKSPLEQANPITVRILLSSAKGLP